MKDTSYLYYLKGGDLYYQCAMAIPLLLWTYIIYRWYAFENTTNSLVFQYKNLFKNGFFSKKISYHVTNIFIFIFRTFIIAFLLLSPYIFVIWTIIKAWYYSNDVDFNKASMPPGWNPCLNTDIPESLSKKGVIGTIDYLCLSVQNTTLNAHIRALVDRFYYINYCLFLIVVMIFKNTRTSWQKSPFLANWIFISLMLGIMGSVMTCFNTTGIISQTLANLGSTLVVMNISAFGIVLFALLHAIYFNK